jgi:hypothetical protein
LNTPPEDGRARALEPAVVIPALAAKMLIHLAAATRYGYFRDELYYLACADRLAWGYVDHPPLSIAVLALVRAVLGDSLPALRLVPALAGALAIVFTVAVAARMGAGRLGQALAAAAMLAAPRFAGIAGFYSMNSLDLVFWTCGAWLVVRALDGEPRAWPLLGLVLGLGLLNKVSLLWFGGGLAAGLLLTPARHHLRTRGPWVAAAVALALFSPHLLWQMGNGWPTLEFMRNATAFKMATRGVGAFTADMALVMNPATLPLWLGGLAFLLVGREGARWRALGAWFVALFLVLALPGTSRTQYISPAFPPLFAAGAVALESFAARRRAWRWLPRVLLAVLLASGALFAPLAAALFPVETYIAYARALGLAPASEERKSVGELPQHFADMFGWEEMAQAVAEVHGRLSPQEQATAVVFAQNYGEAGALEHFGRDLGLPPVISGHNSYWLWGPRGGGQGPVIILGGDAPDHRAAFASVEEAGRTACRYCMPYERDLPIFVARGLRRPLAEVWPRVKHYD